MRRRLRALYLAATAPHVVSALAIAVGVGFRVLGDGNAPLPR